MDNQEVNDFIGYYYSNPKLYKEVKNKESLIKNLLDKALKCPYCKEGHYLWEDNGGDYYGYQSWFECSKCGATPSPYREQMIDETKWFPEWDYTLYELMCNFCSPDRFNFEIPKEKRRPFKEFNPEEWNKEAHRFYNDDFIEITMTWDELVEREIAEYIKQLDKIIENAKKYKCLRKIVGNCREKLKS